MSMQDLEVAIVNWRLSTVVEQHRRFLCARCYRRCGVEELFAATHCPNCDGRLFMMMDDHGRVRSIRSS
jgi:DNA-directed RNA polymerase subunit RPC12/RpoP